MKTLAIVSSYSESCGNAAFTKILHETIGNYSDVQVEVLALNLKLLQSTDIIIRGVADAHINDLSKRLKSFDSVNLQVESGLYGTLHRDVLNRLKKLINSNPNTTVTLHSPRIIASPSEPSLRSVLSALAKFKLRTGIGQFLALFRGNHIKLNKKIISHAVKQRCRIIVHTLRAKEQISLIFNYDNVDVHPLKMVPDNFQPQQSYIQQIKAPLSLSENDVLIGMFGYFGSYKGHIDAINAMRYLPENYKLLIFGRQHPQSIKADGKVDQYLDSLIKLVTKNPSDKLHDRVLFIGELSDEEFLHMAASVDLAWLPYYENGQDGSGIASICFDLSPKILCSSSLAFDELFRLIPYDHYLRFDIGNPLELANKTKMIMRQSKSNIKKIPNNYTIKSQVAVYAKDLETV
jgi:glycosyltransferase involved in cell wall biosynthesis